MYLMGERRRDFIVLREMSTMRFLSDCSALLSVIYHAVLSWDGVVGSMAQDYQPGTSLPATQQTRPILEIVGTLLPSVHCIDDQV